VRAAAAIPNEDYVRQPRLRRGIALAATVVFTGAGGSAVGWALTHQTHPPQPTAAAAGSLDASTSAPQTSGKTIRGGVGPILRRSLPRRISIPAIRVSSSIQSVGLTRAGALAVPQPGPHYNQAAWFTGSPSPGQLGPAVVEGHVDSVSQGPSVFFRLGALKPGDRVYITRADRSVAAFTIDGVRRYAKNAFPTSLVYGNTVRAELRLITCGGAFDRATGHYLDNIVVFAHLTGSS